MRISKLIIKLVKNTEWAILLSTLSAVASTAALIDVRTQIDGVLEKLDHIKEKFENDGTESRETS